MQQKTLGRRKAVLNAFNELKKLIKEGMAEDKSAPVKCSKCGKEFSTAAKFKNVEKKFSEAISTHNSLCSGCRENSLFQNIGGGQTKKLFVI